MPTKTTNPARLMTFLVQVGKFGAVGLVGFAVDVTVFNLLRTTVFDPHLVHAGPIYAKVFSTILAIFANCFNAPEDLQ